MPSFAPLCDNCDEALTYPRVSTGQIARSGKVAGADVVRTPIQAHFQPVFGARSNRNAKPQGLEEPEVFIPRMAVASVHAPIWRRHAGGFGQRQVGSIQGSERREVTGQAENLADWKNSGKPGESRHAAALVNGKGTKASAKRKGAAAKTGRCKPEGRRNKPAGAQAGCRRERR